MTKLQKQEIEQEKKSLLALIERAAKDISGHPVVYLILRHVSRSGMYRVLDSYLSIDGDMHRITHSHALILNGRYDRRHEGLGVTGCGMDMGFDAVYRLSTRLYCKTGYTGEGASYLSSRWL